MVLQLAVVAEVLITLVLVVMVTQLVLGLICQQAVDMGLTDKTNTQVV